MPATGWIITARSSGGKKRLAGYVICAYTPTPPGEAVEPDATDAVGKSPRHGDGFSLSPGSYPNPKMNFASPAIRSPRVACS